jgi:hypothetical protein
MLGILHGSADDLAKIIADGLWKRPHHECNSAEELAALIREQIPTQQSTRKDAR